MTHYPTGRFPADTASEWPDRPPSGSDNLDPHRLEALGGRRITDADRALAVAGLHRRGAADLIPMLGLDNAPIRMTPMKGHKR